MTTRGGGSLSRSCSGLLLLCLFFVLSAHETEARGVLAVLQKTSPGKIHELETRNKRLSDVFFKEGGRDVGFDVVIFCERRMSVHEKQLRRGSKLPLKFVYVDESLLAGEADYLKSKLNLTTKTVMSTLCPANAGSIYFSLGYKGMCQFWSSGFLQFVKNYDWLLRVDDDCHLLKLETSDYDMSSLFPLPDHVPFAPALWKPSQICSIRKTVTGLFNFTQEFMTKHNISSPEGKPKNISAYVHFSRDANGTIAKYNCQFLAPYTNVMYWNLKWLRGNALVQSFMQEVKETRCIFNNRWGDLELWGAIQLLLESPVYYTIPLPYYHGSHGCNCNPFDLKVSSRSKRKDCSSLHETKSLFTNTSVNLSFPLVNGLRLRREHAKIKV